MYHQYKLNENNIILCINCSTKSQKLSVAFHFSAHLYALDLTCNKFSLYVAKSWVVYIYIWFALKEYLHIHLLEPTYRTKYVNHKISQKPTENIWLPVIVHINTIICIMSDWNHTINLFSLDCISHQKITIIIIVLTKF